MKTKMKLAFLLFLMTSCASQRDLPNQNAPMLKTYRLEVLSAGEQPEEFFSLLCSLGCRPRLLDWKTIEFVPTHPMLTTYVITMPETVKANLLNKLRTAGVNARLVQTE